MVLPPKQFWYAVAVLVGSTVGIGFYGIPFVLAKSSSIVGLSIFLTVGFFVLCTNLLYGEIILRTTRRHQFVGYVHKYLGIWPQRLNKFNFWLAVYGALVGIIILGGEFLSQIGAYFVSVDVQVYTVLFTLVAGLMVARGLKTVSRLDFLMMLIFASFTVGLLFLSGIYGEHRVLQLDFNSYWFLPFGVSLFALNGIHGIPLLRETLIGKEKYVKKAIILGTLFPITLYIIFAIAIIGLSGESTTPDAISGLRDSLGPNIVFIGSILGFLTSLSIFVNIATALSESLREDFAFKGWWRILLVTLAPLLLFFLGIRNFIDIIGLVGGVGISVDTILLIFVYISARRKGTRMPEYSIKFPNILLYILIALFALGAIYTILL